MASIVSAGTTSATALNMSADTTGILQLASNNGTVALTISTAQVVSFTNPPTATGGGGVATNTAYGTGALAATATGSRSSAFGYQALNSMTSGDPNTAFGYFALKLNTGGAANVALGAFALQTNVSGASNVAVGNECLSLNTASYNTAIGASALQANTTASYGTAVGYQAGFSSVTADYNTFIGYYAGRSTTGDQNTFVGKFSGNAVTTGTLNTILGAYNGNQGSLDIRTASNYIVLSDGGGTPRLIGNGSGNWGIGKDSPAGAKLYIYVNSGATTDALVSQPDANVTVNAYVFKNNTGGNAGYIQYSSTTTSYVTSSDYRLKENIAPMMGALAKVAQLKPVTYDWKSGGSSQGFIAHELQEVMPEAVCGQKDAVDKDGNPDYQGIDTSFLVATLTAAIQELKAINDQQAETINALTARVASLENK